MPVTPKRGAWARLFGRDPAVAVPASGAVELAAAPLVCVCVVWRDRDDFGWLLGRKRVEQFTTALDPDDPQQVQNALAACAYRNEPDAVAEDPAVVLRYAIDVYELGPGGEPGRQLVFDYRPAPELFGPGPYVGEYGEDGY